MGGGGGGGATYFNNIILKTFYASDFNKLFYTIYNNNAGCSDTVGIQDKICRSIVKGFICENYCAKSKCICISFLSSHKF